MTSSVIIAATTTAARHRSSYNSRRLAPQLCCWLLQLVVAPFYCSAFASVVPKNLIRYPALTTRHTFVFYRRNRRSTLSLKKNRDDDDDEDVVIPPPMELPGDEQQSSQSISTAKSYLEQLTMSQLKQQLRLRNLKISGRKVELVDRLYKYLHPGADNQPETTDGTDETFVDVSAYLDPDDQGKSFKSSNDLGRNDDDEKEASSPEVWGSEARLSLSEEDIADKRVVIDTLSTTHLEFRGSNQTYVNSVVIATRDALKPYLKGGHNSSTGVTPATIVAATEQRLFEIQQARERETARPVQAEDAQLPNDGDETGIFAHVLDREISDWGKYTVTGAQLSAEEIEGVLLLSDVYGYQHPDIIALAEKIAFECQPVIVMIPDLFRDRPWTGPIDGVSAEGQSFEEWRLSHSDWRVNVDIRAAAACLRETYGVTSVVVWGLCYGGGRALEAASGWMPSIHDVDGVTVGPPPVDPSVVVAWYPTRYNANLFGKTHVGRKTAVDGSPRKMAVMGVFGEKDTIQGATTDDALSLKKRLEKDDRVIDHMVKVFPDKDHGFAHQGLSESQHELGDSMERFVDEEFGGAGRLAFAEGDAEVACLLSTAFMETYSRVFLPTVGPPISLDDSAKEWSEELKIKNLRAPSNRNIREEIQNSLENYVEEPLESGPFIDPSDTDQEAQLAALLRSMEPPDRTGPLKIEDDDDLYTIYGKLTSADENFQLF